MNNFKLGSLFDGSGGFPLSGALCGITPMWAAEVEPYPIAVTRSRFPNMKHLGDISKVNGAEIEPVDIITFGSPCQDLSVAGKRAGLKHEANGDEETTRSGLFMEAVRIIKEMRTATNGNYPRFAIWENVPGAFSSNNGEDFRIVCEELIKIVEPSALMPPVPKNGWNYADSYVGDGWSLAYRVFDAQYWGVPQRRRRIYLVADLGGECAREVLFEREGLRGYFAQGRTPWQAAPADAQGSPGADDREREGNNCITPWDVQSRRMFTPDGPWPALYGGEGGGHGYVVTEPNGDGGRQLDAVGLDVYNQTSSGDVAISIRCKGDNEHTPCVVYSVENHPADSRVNIDDSGKVQTLTSRMGTGGGNVPMVMEPKEPVYCLQGNGIDRADTAGCNGKGVREDVCYTLNTIDRPAVVYAVDQGGGKSGANVTENKAPTLCTTHGGEPAVAYGLDRASFNQGQNAKFDFTVSEEQQPTLTARGPGAVCVADHPTPKVDEKGVAYTLNARDYKAPLCAAYEVTQPPRYIVRRLTPTECARLQGFADQWGWIEEKKALTEEEYHFWLEVRNTHARINGKPEKDYTEKQMLTWYNKLWTDSAEYKMWGNGIALPTALYCIQGMAEMLAMASTRKAVEDDDDWMN